MGRTPSWAWASLLRSSLGETRRDPTMLPARRRARYPACRRKAPAAPGGRPPGRGELALAHLARRIDVEVDLLAALLGGAAPVALLRGAAVLVELHVRVALLLELLLDLALGHHRRAGGRGRARRARGRGRRGRRRTRRAVRARLRQRQRRDGEQHRRRHARNPQHQLSSPLLSSPVAGRMLITTG